MNATSRDAKNQPGIPSSSRRGLMLATAALALPALATAMPNTPATDPLATQREELAGLCYSVEVLYSWWRANEARIEALDHRMAYEIRDHFVGAVMDSRNIADAAGSQISKDAIGSLKWNRITKKGVEQ